MPHREPSSEVTTTGSEVTNNYIANRHTANTAIKAAWPGNANRNERAGKHRDFRVFEFFFSSSDG